MVIVRLGELKSWREATGVRIAVEKHLRGYKKNSFDYIMPELSPPQELSERLKKKIITKRNFVKLYVKSLFNQEAVDTIRKIKKMNVVYLLSNHEAGFSHTRMLKIILEEFKFPYQDRRCPYFIQNDPRLRCRHKEELRRFWEMPTKSPRIKVTVERSFVHDALQCNFALQSPEPGVVRGLEVLKDCLIFKNKTKIFTCKSCFFKRYKCLRTEIDPTEGGYCDCYVHEDLHYGNDIEVFKLRFIMYMHCKKLSEINEILMKKR